MRLLLPLCLVLTCWVLSGSCCSELELASAVCYNSSCPSSCQACVVPGNCRNPLLAPTNFGVQLSPFYAQVVVLNDQTVQMDNVCYTAYQISLTTILTFESIVLVDGTNIIVKYIQTEIQGSNGVFQCQGVDPFFNCSQGCVSSSSCAFNIYVLGEACPNTFALYNCYFAGDCANIDANAEIRVGISSYRDLSECCKRRLIELANAQSDSFYLARDFYILPNRMNRRCVAWFNHAPCVNAQDIHEHDSISIPYHSDYCYEESVRDGDRDRDSDRDSNRDHDSDRVRDRDHDSDRVRDRDHDSHRDGDRHRDSDGDDDLARRIA